MKKALLALFVLLTIFVGSAAILQAANNKLLGSNNPSYKQLND